MTATHPFADRFDAAQVKRPDPQLLHYYLVVALMAGPLYPIAVVPLLCRYYTLEYGFDEHGVSVRWGVLFRREIFLTYRRIQDIHLTRNVLQRWLGLATVSIQTAAGSGGPEMVIEGVLAAEALRDYLYLKMRGVRDESGPWADDGHASAIDRHKLAAARDVPRDEALVLLTEIRDALTACAERRET